MARIAARRAPSPPGRADQAESRWIAVDKKAGLVGERRGSTPQQPWGGVRVLIRRRRQLGYAAGCPMRLGVTRLIALGNASVLWRQADPGA